MSDEATVVGVRAVEALLAHRVGRIRRILIADEGGPRRTLAAAARAAGVRVEIAARKQLDARAEGLRHQGVIAIAEPAEYVDWVTLLEPGDGLLIALDELTDAGNFGAILRSAEALGARGVLVTKHRCAQLGPTVTRTSAGASELIPVARETNLAAALASASTRGFQIIGADLDGVSPAAIDWKIPSVLVIGAEGKGLRRLTRERCGVIATIPLSGLTESLNAANAAAILLYEAARQRGAGESFDSP